MKEHKLDIFQVLRAIDTCDGDWLSRRSDEERAGFIPYTAMQWTATLPDGPEAEYMLWTVNDRVNGHLFDLAHTHPDLIFRLLASCGLGTPKRHQWIKPASHKAASNPVTKLLEEHYPQASEHEIAVLISMFDRESFQQFLNDCGIQPDEAKEMVKSYGKLNPEETPRKRRNNA